MSQGRADTDLLVKAIRPSTTSGPRWAPGVGAPTSIAFPVPVSSTIWLRSHPRPSVTTAQRGCAEAIVQRRTDSLPFRAPECRTGVLGGVRTSLRRSIEPGMAALVARGVPQVLIRVGTAPMIEENRTPTPRLPPVTSCSQ